VLPGYFIDHDAGRCVKGTLCSFYFRDSWPIADESQDGSYIRGHRPVVSSLTDYPFGWTIIESISLETCAVCADTTQIIACMKWGATWPETGVRQIHQIEGPAEPSATFIEALTNFERFY
jgi:hypothetical protein